MLQFALFTLWAWQFLNTDISQASVRQASAWSSETCNDDLLQIYYWVRQRKNFESG